MFVNRGIYHQGWTAVTRHSIPWDQGKPLPPIDDDVWELYGPDDWTQAHDLAADNPEQLAHLQQKFLLEASKYKVFPLDDRRIERFNSDLAGRPTLIRGNSQVLFGGMGRLTENVVLNVKNKSHAVTADLTVPDGGAQRRHRRPGRRLRRLEHLPARGPPDLLLQPVRPPAHPTSAPTRPVPAGDHQVRLEFTYDGGGLGKGATADLYLDGTQVASGRIDATVPLAFSGDETLDVGSDTGTPVSDDYTSRGSHFTGRIHRVQIDLGDDAHDNDHLITPEERMRIITTRQ